MNSIDFYPENKELKAAFSLVERMKVGQIMIIKNIAPNKPDLLIKCLKIYIDCCGDLEFNTDFTIAKKIYKWKDVCVEIQLVK